METITSRENPFVKRLRALGSESALRRETGETVLDGLKLLNERFFHG